MKGAQLRLFELLSDGEYHTKAELCNHANCTIKTIAKHICLLRKALPEDETIVCEIAHRIVGYRHIKLLIKKS